jgi:hypothetical protein
MKRMEQQELLQDAIGMIGEDLIDDADRRPRRPIIIRWSAVACACLAVVIGLSAIFGSSSEPWIPTGKPWQPVIAEGVEEVRLEADVLQNLFSYTYYGETNAYVKKYAPHIGALAVSPIPQAEYLPITRLNTSKGTRRNWKPLFKNIWLRRMNFTVMTYGIMKSRKVYTAHRIMRLDLRKETDPI